MVNALFYFVALVAFALVGLVLRRRQHGRRKPTQLPMVLILAALGAAFFFLAPASQAVESRIVPSLGRLLSNICTLVAAYGFLTLMLHVSHPPEQIRSRSRWRLLALVVALAVMAVMFLASHPPSGTGVFTGLYRSQPTLAVYTMVYSAYLGVAVVDVAWLGFRSVRHVRGYLRVGMVIVSVGCLLALGYVTQKVLSILTELFGGGAAEQLCAGPFSTVGCTFSVGMPALSVLAIIVGAAVPPLGPRIEAAVRWPARLRAHRRLRPLWEALYDAVPEIALTSPQAVQGSVPRRDMEFRLYRRVIEISDGLLVLRPYRDPEATPAHRERAERAGLTGRDLAAAVEAADVDTALRRRRAGVPAVDEATPVESPPESDLVAETAWLTLVSSALVRVMTEKS
ncbi:hypothetical protein F0L68_28775 [Solihabitans fulvus]|uniref:DUF6545 domain-containing protein n=1 Tax=Solihabitans fulvus TaxID=1892852 RepID=A0A5B2WXV2_9PSEU|nr:MAB_1171c family putative transporter [Solihabitans fulvus]KAA2255219.1 hypothetical protein F0L68_28775 [Solihabitans fulvus]